MPAFGALVAEPLFLLADSAIVGQLGTLPLAGLGIAAAALSTVVYGCVFLAYGTTAAVARLLGAGDVASAIRQGMQGVWLALGVGSALAAVLFFAAHPVVRVLGASPDAAPYAVTYLRIGAFGIPGMLLILAATGTLRGLQDTRTPLVVTVTASAVNLGLNAWLVLGLNLGIAGSAAGTTVTQLASAAAYLTVLTRGAKRHGASVRPDRSLLRASATANAALLIRTIALRLVLITATAVAARIGDAAVAAHQVAFAVWTLLALSLDAVAIAGQALIGRYLGAGNRVQARAATTRMLWWGIASGVLTSILVLLIRPWLPDLYNTAVAIRPILLSVLLIIALLQPICGIVFVLDGILIGAGDMRYLAIAGICSTLVFCSVAWLIVFEGAGLMYVWWALGLWMMSRLALLGARTRGDSWMVTGAVRSTGT